MALSKEAIAGLAGATGDLITTIAPLFPGIGTGLFLTKLIAGGISRQAGMPHITPENLAEIEEKTAARIESNLADAQASIESMEDRRKRLGL